MYIVKIKINEIKKSNNFIYLWQKKLNEKWEQ